MRRAKFIILRLITAQIKQIKLYNMSFYPTPDIYSRSKKKLNQIYLIMQQTMI